MTANDRGKVKGRRLSGGKMVCHAQLELTLQIRQSSVIAFPTVQRLEHRKASEAADRLFQFATTLPK